MGIVKTIYNVLGGFYSHYNSMTPTKSVNKVTIFLSPFLCIFYIYEVTAHPYNLISFGPLATRTTSISISEHSFIFCGIGSSDPSS